MFTYVYSNTPILAVSILAEFDKLRFYFMENFKFFVVEKRKKVFFKLKTN